MDLSFFIEKWKQSGASERANAAPFLLDLCDVLGVEKPGAATGDPERDRFVFERPVTLVHGGERHSVGFIDLYKQAMAGAIWPESAGPGVPLLTGDRGAASSETAVQRLHAKLGQTLMTSRLSCCIPLPPPEV